MTTTDREEMAELVAISSMVVSACQNTETPQEVIREAVVAYIEGVIIFLRSQAGEQEAWTDVVERAKTIVSSDAPFEEGDV